MAKVDETQWSCDPGCSRVSGSGRATRGQFLAADVGGTHARIALVRSAHGSAARVVIDAHEKYVGSDFASLPAIIQRFLIDHQQAGTRIDVDALVLACAGSAHEDAVVNSNLPWPVRLGDLGRELGISSVYLVNDLQAAAYGLSCLDATDSLSLSGPVDLAPEISTVPTLIVGVGTGLGAAIRVENAGSLLVLPTEAGQTAFAPGDEREIEVMRWLLARHGYVATEHVVSGPGLVNVHQALCALAGVACEQRAPAAITEAARCGDVLARDAVLMFCAMFGGVIGDLTLIAKAGQVFIAGGIVPQIKDFIPVSKFGARLVDKGVMRPLLARVPVHLVENKHLGILGAASWYLGAPQACVP